VQVVLLKVPAPFVVNVTVPCGVIAPGPDASLTVAAQVVDVPIWTVLGEQFTAVLLARWPAVTEVVPLLPVWTLSPPYAAVMVCVPIVVGVKVTEHWPLAFTVQLVAGVKVPVPLLAKVTVPVGVVAPAPEVSVTVAVQLVPWLTATDGGVQLTVVLVVRLVNVTFVLPLLVACVLSPPYEAVMACVPVPTAVGV